MVCGKKSKIQLVHKKIKKYYILSIIILLFSSIFPMTLIAEKPVLGPNLTILDVTATSDPSVEGDTVEIYVTIKNIGPQNISIGQQITITMKVDNEQTVTSSLIDSLGLLRNQQRTEHLTWTATLGSTQRRLLHVTVA
jgi:hypothetical protein